MRSRLLAWYDRSRRDLPWRTPPGAPQDPYHIWVSEVMLQQTRVETALPYYERWMERFPTLDDLAAAPLDEVLKHWEGLGYYSRARNLHKAVREVAERYGGEVPDDSGAFRELPGVGRYTAGAVMSIAFGREEPLVDGNVRRVFARLTDDAEPEDSRLWALAGELVQGDRPGDLNQALMELGATVCTPRNPRCSACPIRSDCKAHANGTAEQRPAPRRKKALPHEDEVIAIVQFAGKYLLTRRPADGRLGGMWHFPSATMRPREPLEDAAGRAIRRVVDLAATHCREIDSFSQTFTHVKVRYRVVECAIFPGELGESAYEEIGWVAPEDFDRYALPAAQKRIARSLVESISTGR